jgi:uncharacterized membrane protein YbhN (UPF0104 family)
MAAQPSVSIDVSAVDPIAALRRMAAGDGRSTVLRRAAPIAALVALVTAIALVAPGIAAKFGDALDRALHANPAWVAAAIALELASFAGYVALFWHVSGRTTPRMGLRASWEVALASTAATRLLPTAGAGGAALTFWSLRRSGQDNGAATRTLLTFLVVLYSVFLGAIAVAGALLASGAASSHVSAELSAIPAGAAAAAVGIALLLAARHRRSAGAAEEGATSRAGRVRHAGHALGGAVNDAIAVVRRPHARLLGALAWWGFDLLVLWCTFNAFGLSPAPVVLVLGYFLGQVANTVPLPGAASGGMVGAMLALGMPAEVALPAVLAYRAIAIWTPVPFGAVALTGLRRTVRRWAEEDGAAATEDTATAPAPALAPTARARRNRPALTIALPRPLTLIGTGQRAPPAAGLARRPVAA